MTLDALDFPRILEMTSKVRIDCRPSMDVHVSAVDCGFTVKQ